MNDTLQAGPCVICGGTNYNLSCGGPTICPKCDCGSFDAATVATQAKVISSLRQEIERLRAALATTPAAGGEDSIPTYGNLPWDQLGRDVMESLIDRRDEFKFDPAFYPGHQSLNINFNSLARIVDKYRIAAQPASPLRGRDETWRIIVDIMVSHLGYSYPMLADRIADALTSPPEQPVADPGVGRAAAAPNPD